MIMAGQLTETQSRWGNLYNRRFYIDGRRVTQAAFDSAYAKHRLTAEHGEWRRTPYGYRGDWVPAPAATGQGAVQ